jgi:hypothetical protein
MNKPMQWVMAATLICGSSVLTSCSNDDNPVDPAENLSEKIIGKWMQFEIDGRLALTNEKSATTFVSDTKAYFSSSKINHSETSQKWNDNREYEVKIDGNKVTLTSKVNENVTLVNEFIISSINETEMNCIYKHVTIRNGKEYVSVESSNRCYKKVTTDYRDAIVGTWEGRCTSEGSVFDDGQEHRWQYNADGTYVYYVKDGNNWVPYATNTLNEYFVDGTLLCTRWIDNGVENREWWEITITDGKMNWTALRQNEDGTTFTATFEMKKVE